MHALTSWSGLRRAGPALAVTIALIASAFVVPARADGPAPEQPSMDGKIVFQSDQAGDPDVWIMDGDGTDQHKLTQEPANLDRDDGEPSFAGDATRIVFASCRDADQLAPCSLGEISKVVGNANVFAMKPDGTAQTRLTTNFGHDADPQLSRDGSKVVFVSFRDLNAEVYVMNADGTSQTRRTNNLANDFDPAWSPDGTKIVFTSARDGNNEIYVMNGGDPQRLTNNGASDTHPAWSADGAQVAFVSTRDGSEDIYVMDASDGGHVTRLTTDGSADRDPAWSPDGSEIAFSSDRDGNDEIFLMNADGTAQTQVTHTTSTNRYPDWAENLLVTASPTTTTASPAAIPLQHIPLQPASPQTATDTAGGSLKLDDIGLAGSSIGLDDIGLGPSSLPLDDIGLGGSSLPLDDIGLGGSSIGLDDIGLGPSSIPLEDIGLGWVEALRRIPTSSIVLRNGLTWEQIFLGTRFAGQLPQTVSLGDLITTPDMQAPTVGTIALADLDLTQPPFGSIGLLPFLLGDTAIQATTAPFTPADWCARINALGFASCGSSFGGLDSSFLEAQLGGLPFNDEQNPIPLQAITVSGVAFDADAPLLQLYVRALDLELTSIGGTTIGSFPAEVRSTIVDCARVSCGNGSTVTLAEAARLVPTAIAQGARFGDLLSDASGTVGSAVLGEVMLALVGDYPVETIPYELLGIRGWRGAISSAVTYSVRYAPVAVASAANPVVRLDLPQRFFFDSATLRANGGPSTAVTPVSRTEDATGTHLRFDVATVDAGSKATLDVVMRPGDRMGGDLPSTVSLTAPGVNELRQDRARVTVIDTFEPNDDCAAEALPAVQSGVLYTSFTTDGDTDCFRLAAPPAGSLVTFVLAHQDIDRDLVVYSDGDSDEPLRSAAAGQRPLELVADDGLGFNNSTAPVQPDGFSVPLVQGLTVTGFSQLRGAEDDRVSVVSGGTGSYTVQVSPYNAATSGRPYTLRIKVLPPRVLEGVEPTAFPFDADPSGGADEAATRGIALTNLDPTTQTLVLFNRDRWADRFGAVAATTAEQKLQTLAAHLKVRGALLEVDGRPEIRAAYDAWDADPADVEKGNDVVRAINDYIDELLAQPGAPPRDQIRYVVAAGDHLMVPMGAVRDLTEWGNERWYADPFDATGVNAYSAAYLLGYVLTDNAYLAPDPQPVPGGWNYPTTWSGGRLVETTQDLATAVDAFVASDGVVNPLSALSVGTDFMKDLAGRVKSAADAGLATQSTALIDDTYTLDQLRTALASGRDVVGLQQHSDAFRTLPAAAGSQPYTTQDLDAIVGGIGKLWLTMGCHTGDSRPDLLGASGDARLRDWAQATAARTAFLVAQSAYGLGGRETLALSEDILARAVRKMLGVGGVAMPAAQALASARLDYLADNGIPGVYDKKALEEATFYGLPMYGVPTAQPVDLTLPNATPGTTTPDPVTGIASAAFTVTPSYELVVTPNGNYLNVTGQTPQFTHYRPITARSAVNVGIAGLRARGVTIESRASQVQNDVQQAIAQPVLSGSAVRQPHAQLRDVNFPAVPATVTGGTTQKLVSLLTHFAGTGQQDGTVTGRRIKDTQVTYRVYYSNDADVVPPEFVHVDVTSEQTQTGYVAHFTARVTDNLGAANVKGVSSLYLDQNATWHLVQLQRSAIDAALWTADATYAGPGIEALFQAVDTAGNARFELLKGLHIEGLEFSSEEPYDFDGFFSPFLGKTVNAGSTFPLKWTLTRDGVPVTDVGAVVAIWSYALGPDGQIIPGTVAEPQSMADLSEGDPNYHYNWRTSVAWAGQTRALQMDFDDGNSQSVLVRFKN